MRNIYVIYLILFVCTVGFSAAPLPQEPDAFEDFTVELSDLEIEDEVRRRYLGGPWEPQQAMSILNEAIERVTSPNETCRPTKFSNEAKILLTLLTGMDDPYLEIQPDITTNMDPDYIDDPIIVGEGHEPSLATIKKILDMIDGTNGERRRSLDSVEKLYPRFNRRYVSRYRARIEGTRKDKLKAMNHQVFSKFSESRRKLQPVHGRMIQRWARQIASQMNLTEFGASLSWLALFKRRHGIVSRKVTNYMGRAELSKSTNISKSIIDFKVDYSRECKRFDKEFIFNFDQTGFQSEPSNLRTLSFKGERDTELMVDSKAKSTHSYTVMPMVSRSGKLFEKLLIVLQERDGAFGPKIKKQVAELENQFGNIEVIATKSGKLSSGLVNDWFEGTLSRAAQDIRERRMMDDSDGPAMLVLADSWGGHSSIKQQQLLQRIGVDMLKIPPSTTDSIQPLDVNVKN